MEEAKLELNRIRREERVAADRSNSKGKGLKVRTARALLTESTKGQSRIGRMTAGQIGK